MNLVYIKNWFIYFCFKYILIFFTLLNIDFILRKILFLFEFFVNFVRYRYLINSIGLGLKFLRDFTFILIIFNNLDVRVFVI